MKLSSTFRAAFHSIDVEYFILFALMVLAIAIRHPAILAGHAAVSALVIYKKRVSFQNVGSEEKAVSLLIIASCTIMLPLSLIRNPNSAFHFLTTLIALFTAFAIASDAKRYLANLRFILITYQSCICTYLSVYGIEDFPLDKLIEESSSNGITSYLICLQTCYIIANICIGERAGVLTAALTVWISTIGYGRGSVIASLMIFTIAIVYESLLTRNKILRIFVSIALVSISTYLIYNVDSVIYFVNENTKLGSGFFDVERYIINQDYYNRMNGINIFIGVDYYNTVIDRFYNGNPHNSFIRAHNIFGIFYLFSILLAIFLVFIRRNLDIKDAFIGALILILLSRAYTETFLFPTPLDALFFASLIVARRRLV
jgi:hypothetical protein